MSERVSERSAVMADDHLRLALAHVAADQENPDRWRELAHAFRRESCAPLAQVADERADVMMYRRAAVERERAEEEVLARIGDLKWTGYAGAPYAAAAVVHMVDGNERRALCRQALFWRTTHGNRVPCMRCIRKLKELGHDTTALMELRK